MTAARSTRPRPPRRPGALGAYRAPSARPQSKPSSKLTAKPSSKRRSRPGTGRRPSRRRRPRRGEQLSFPPRGRGGPRPGAGRPRSPRSGVPHLPRPRVGPRLPLHITLRLCKGLPSLRSRRAYRVVASALFVARSRFGVRLVVQSTQANHLHLIAEAPDNLALRRAMQGLGIRLARRLNRLWGRRGRVFADRYHLRPLSTPLEVRRALSYVLLNHRRHAAQRRRSDVRTWADPCSSWAQFDGWGVGLRTLASQGGGPGETGPPTVVAPASWLLRTGWRRYGLLVPWEVPGGRRA